MKLSINRSGFLSALQIASGAIGTKNVKPILRNVKAIVTDNGCTLMATDLELGIKLEVRGINVDRPGEAILPLTSMTGILRECSDEELSVELTDSGLVIVRSARSKWEMPTEKVSDFPDVPEFNVDACHEIKGSVLHDMIDKVAFATTAADARFRAISGVLVEAEEAELSMVATDGHCLARMPGAAVCVGGHKPVGQKIIPTKALAMVDKAMDPDESVRVCLRENDVMFKTERATIYTRLVDGRFPNYQKFLPEKFKHRCELKVGEILAAIKQAAVMTSNESIRLVFSFSKGKLTLGAKAMDVGESLVELPIDFDGKLEVWFSAPVWSGCLRRLEPDSTVIFEAFDNVKPGRLTQGNYLYVVMPLHEAK